MARQVKVAAGRLWGYVAVVVAVTALARGYWRPWPDIDASGAEIGTSAYREPNGWYWVSPGQVISCMMSESETAGVSDKDTEYDDATGQQIQVAPGNINLNSMRWEQTGGLWVLEGNNNSPDSEAYGQTVYWTPAPGEDYVCIRFASVDDETDDEDRDDDELEVPNVYKGFHVFRISGPDELWYWALQPSITEVHANYKTMGRYEAALVNTQGYYKWSVTGDLFIQNLLYGFPAAKALEGPGLTAVDAFYSGRATGSIKVSQTQSGLEAQKVIACRYPNDVVERAFPTDPTKSEFQQAKAWVEQWWSFDAYNVAKVDWHSYDEDIKRCKDIDWFGNPPSPPDGPGYASLCLFRVLDEKGQPVPWNYVYYEWYGGDTTQWVGEDWPAHRYRYGANAQQYHYHEGVTCDWEPTIFFTRVFAWHPKDLTPQPQIPHWGSLSGQAVQWTWLRTGYGVRYPHAGSEALFTEHEDRQYLDHGRSEYYE